MALDNTFEEKQQAAIDMLLGYRMGNQATLILDDNLEEDDVLDIEEATLQIDEYVEAIKKVTTTEELYALLESFGNEEE